jgi:hypothetical protein
MVADDGDYQFSGIWCWGSEGQPATTLSNNVVRRNCGYARSVRTKGPPLALGIEPTCRLGLFGFKSVGIRATTDGNVV